MGAKGSNVGIRTGTHNGRNSGSVALVPSIVTDFMYIVKHATVQLMNKFTLAVGHTRVFFNLI